MVSLSLLAGRPVAVTLCMPDNMLAEVICLLYLLSALDSKTKLSIAYFCGVRQDINSGTECQLV